VPNHKKRRHAMRSRLLVWGLILVVSTLYLSACGSSDEVKLGARDDGTQVEMEKGQFGICIQAI